MSLQQKLNKHIESSGGSLPDLVFLSTLKLTIFYPNSRRETQSTGTLSLIDPGPKEHHSPSSRSITRFYG